MMEKSRQGGLRILFADDEAHLRDLMQMELPRLGHEVTVCPDGTAALRAIERGSFDAALLDIRMPGITGIEVLSQIKQISPDTQVIILTGQATVDTAVQALRLGAFDYLTKPCKWAELEVILQPGRRAARHGQQDHGARDPAQDRRGLAPLDRRDARPCSRSAGLIETIAPTEATVMILGETGTGKELVARSLHEKSDRASRAFIPVNCGAFPKTWSRASSSAIARGPSPAPIPTARGSSRSPTAARSSSTRSASSTRACRSSSAVPGIGRDPPRRRERAVPGRRARPLRHQPRPPRDGQERAFPRGSFLPAQHVRDLPAALARPQARHPRARAAPAQSRTPCGAA